MWDDDGQPCKIWLLCANSTPIKRHVKVRVDANPYDPFYETYFEEREEAHMRESFRGTRILRFLWYEQRGLCPVCSLKITPDFGLALALLRLSHDGWFDQRGELPLTSSRVP
jgi:RNA-directed DNA polymerase